MTMCIALAQGCELLHLSKGMKKIVLIGLSFAFAITSDAEVLLKIRREDSFIAVISDARIFINDEQVGKVANASQAQLSTTGGLKTLKIDKTFSTGEFKKSFEFTDECVYTIDVGPRGAMVAYAMLGGLAAMADNVVNKDTAGSDNGVFTIKKFEKSCPEKSNAEPGDSDKKASAQ